MASSHLCIAWEKDSAGKYFSLPQRGFELGPVLTWPGEAAAGGRAGLSRRLQARRGCETAL